MAGSLAAAIVVALTGLSALRFVGWVYPFELFSHFQVQYFVGSLACAAVLAATAHWGWLAAAAACAALSGSALLPYGGPWAAAAHASGPGQPARLRLLTANVLKPNRAHELVLDLVERADADVLLFEEMNERWLEALSPLTTRYPYTLTTPSCDGFCMTVLSRLPLEEGRTVTAGRAGRASFVLKVAVGGDPVTIVCTHPKQPVPPWNFGLRNDQLLAVGALCGELDGPLVLIGDLNLTMWSPWFRRLCADSGLACARRGHGVRPTWPAGLPAWLRVPIDHCLVSDDLEVQDVRLGPRIGSDHLPLIVDLSVR